MREEENNQSSQNSKVKRFFKKRWVFPAIYIACAALILTAVLWYQNSSTENAIDSDKFGYNTDAPGKGFNDPAVEVNRSMENVILPLTSKDQEVAVIQKKFYDDQASEKDQEAALVVYQNQYHPNTGIDITIKDSEGFDVVTALSGVVTKVEEDALLGNVVEIDHDNGIVTQYQSVKDMTVKVGDEVGQGETIATASRSMINEDAGIHVHFEIRKDGMPINPENYLNKPLSAIDEDYTPSVDDSDSRLNEENEAEKQDEVTEEKSSENSEGTTQDQPAQDADGTTEEKPADNQDGNMKDDSSTENPDKSTKDETGSEDKKDSTSETPGQKETPSDEDAKQDQTQNKDA